VLCSFGKFGSLGSFCHPGKFQLKHFLFDFIMDLVGNFGNFFHQFFLCLFLFKLWPLVTQIKLKIFLLSTGYQQKKPVDSGTGLKSLEA
jgi:hypothetical protein